MKTIAALALALALAVQVGAQEPDPPDPAGPSTLYALMDSAGNTYTSVAFPDPATWLSTGQLIQETAVINMYHFGAVAALYRDRSDAEVAQRDAFDKGMDLVVFEVTVPAEWKALPRPDYLRGR